MTRHPVSPFPFSATLLVLCACGGGGGANMPAPTTPDSGGTSTKARSTLSAPSALQSLPLNREFNEPGNIVIADQFNNR